jgi:Spy/CpxP family protein refolding chaperone
MKKIILVGLLTGLTLAGTALPSRAEMNLNLNSLDTSEQLIAQWGWGGKEGGQGKLMESLDLSATQKQQLEAIRQKYQAQMKSVSEQLRTNQNELRTLMSGNGSDNDIRAKHTQVNNLRQQLGEMRFNSMMESRQVLTPAQRQKFSQLMQENRQSRRGGAMGKNQGN